MSEHPVPLSRLERAALAMSRFTNEKALPKRVQQQFIRHVSQPWIRYTVAPRTYVIGLDRLIEQPPDRGMLLASNHRSFFDQYVAMLAMYESGTDWVTRTFFPVRANFFYDKPLGVLVNAAVGGFVMYPPLFRDSGRATLNKNAIGRMVAFLREPGVMIGVHPEGTRGKGSDPYELLPAQPGIGQIVLHAKPMVVPLFLNGLGNNFLRDIARTYEPGVRQKSPIIAVFGDPLDYEELTHARPRTALYKRCADRIRDAILGLAEVEKDIRAACLRGDIRDDDPCWLHNRRQRRRANGHR